MIKEEWLKIRTQQEFPISVCYDYFIEQTNSDIDIKNFERIYMQILTQGLPILNSQGKPVLLTFQNIYHKIFNHYENKFK
jgi:hypothetical protein